MVGIGIGFLKIILWKSDLCGLVGLVIIIESRWGIFLSFSELQRKCEKMQEKNCIYEKNVVPLHRQTRKGGMTTPQV